MHLIRRQFPMALPIDILGDCNSHFESYLELDMELIWIWIWVLVLVLISVFTFGAGKCMTLAAQPKNEIRPRHGGRSQRRPERQQQICAAAVPGQAQSIARQKLGPASEKYGFSFKPGHAAQKGDRTVAEAYSMLPPPPKWKRKRNQKAPFVRASSILTRPSTVRGARLGSWLDRGGAGRQFACTVFIVFRRAKIKTKKTEKKKYSNQNSQ